MEEPRQSMKRMSMGKRVSTQQPDFQQIKIKKYSSFYWIMVPTRNTWIKMTLLLRPWQKKEATSQQLSSSSMICLVQLESDQKRTLTALSALWLLPYWSDCSLNALSALEIWWLTALDKFVPDGRTDRLTFAVLELIFEPKIMTHFFSRFYQGEQTDKGPIGKLPDLREKASESASKIQAYVNYVLGLTPYTSLADKKIAKVNIEIKIIVSSQWQKIALGSWNNRLGLSIIQIRFCPRFDIGLSRICDFVFGMQDLKIKQRDLKINQ